MTRPYLSFTEQPSLKELLKLAFSGKSFNLVYGAGVSMGAGLPSWPQMVERLAADITDNAIRAAVQADPVDIIRKADIIKMLLAGSRTAGIRKELYPHNSQPPPGSLAVAIGRLAISNPNLVYLITTNYDNLVEHSIEVESDGAVTTKPYTLDDVSNWSAASRQADTIPILHIHGFLGLADSELREPLILTESEFRRYGAKIRQILADEMKKRPTVFVGVSLTDPNVVGPLDELRNSTNRQPTFVLSGPDAVEGIEPSAMLEYSKVKAAYLERVFGTQVIRSKSYGQVYQIMREMLAVQDPTVGGKAFFTKRSSSRYGFRFQGCLKAAYVNLGCKKHSCRVTPEVLEATRQELSKAIRLKLRPKVALAVDPLRDKIKRELHADLVESSTKEPFSINLWLRLPSLKPGDPAEYAIQPVGCSAFSYTDTWPYVSPQMIAPFSGYPAVTAVYTESTQLVRLANTDQSWCSMLAVPLMLAEQHGGELCLGAVTAVSAYEIPPADEVRSAPGKPVSVFAAAERDRTVMDNIAAVLNQIGLTAIGFG